MKKFSKLISFLLVFVFLFHVVAQPASAIGYDRQIEHNLGFNEDIDVKQVFEDLSPEAKQIFLEYMLSENKEMLSYHMKHVGGINISVESKAYELQSAVAVNPGLVLKTLNIKLNALNLGTEVVYALMGAASSMLSSIASLGAGTIFSILVAAGCSVVIITKWSSISGKWDKIVRAFQESFTTVSASTISSGFNQAKNSYVESYTDMQVIDYVVKSAPMTSSVAKHIEISLVDQTRKKSNYEIYYSPKRKVALLKYEISRGIKANLNSNWSKDGAPYENSNYDISGATLFILYDFNKKQIFHAHIRVSGSRHINTDTETMRRANNLSWRVKPFPMKYEVQYEGTREKAYFPGNQLSR
ncbi:hypothetical protein [Tissierella sp. P1]|uniref:hypothetical protein n=1 Tax=Tissierella sp. P1 TaxID=1280483 RepID=UPI00117EF038|nr:hypothetical protein [Tissierella sp. P1]